MKNVTVKEAFETAIEAEKNAERFFRGLETKFDHNEEVSLFWKQYAEEEVTHARWLKDLKAKLDQEQLAKIVDENTVELLDAVAKVSIEKALDSVHDLEGAYVLAYDMESGETNSIFRFLVDNFEPDKNMREFLHAQLGDHLGRLTTNLPPQFHEVITRRKIKAFV